jgi:hypothetical protein
MAAMSAKSGARMDGLRLQCGGVTAPVPSPSPKPLPAALRVEPIEESEGSEDA